MRAIVHARLELESTRLQDKENLLERLFSALCSPDYFKQTLHYFRVLELFCYFFLNTASQTPLSLPAGYCAAGSGLLSSDNGCMDYKELAMKAH